MILGLYEPKEGVVMVDGTDIRQIDPKDLRNATGYIAQDIILFQGTVRDNITASHPDAEDDAILACAKNAGVDEFIARHPLGYDAQVGERGANFSGGQRQAIAFARAMITEPNILVCDEPTNAMDTQAEQAFCRYVNEQIEGKTLVLVTHKHSMMQMVDRLILVHQGEVVMDGPRDDVINALKSGSVKGKA